MSTRLRIYLGIQYTLNVILAIVIIALMALTLIKYNSSKNVKGAWPANPVLSPTFLMLVVSCVNVLVDVANLLVQCCGAKAIKRVADVVMKVRTTTGTITAVAPAVAAGFSAFAQNTTNGADLWGFSCSSAADQMAAVNSADMVCMANVSLLCLLLPLSLLAFLLSVLLTYPSASSLLPFPPTQAHHAPTVNHTPLEICLRPPTHPNRLPTPQRVHPAFRHHASSR
jgi:hypothetical protein